MKQESIFVDVWVQVVQEWLNETYSGREGYNEIDEDGRTGWPTIYALIRALQLELGLTPADNFGDGTKAAWDVQVTEKLKEGYESNIVKIINGAFRCKGFGNGKFTEEYNSQDKDMILDPKFQEQVSHFSKKVKFVCYQSAWLLI